MNYTNMKIFSSKKVIKDVQKNIKELEPKFTLKDKQQIVDKIRNVFQNWLRVSYAGELNISFIPNLVLAYHDKDEINYSSFIEKWFDKDLNLWDLIDENDNAKVKSTIYSFLYSYYFTIGNYKKTIELIKLVNNDSANYKYFNVDNNEFYGFSMNELYKEEDSYHNSELIIKRHLIMLYALADDKESKKDKHFQTSYITDLSTLARTNRTDEFLSDKMLMVMHQKVMHDYFEGKKAMKVRNRNTSYSLLDDFETKPETLTELLSQFPIRDESSYWKISSRDDWNLKGYINELDNNKERLIEIFNSYLYSQYALGQKTFKLEDRILQMCSMLNVLGYDEYNVMDIVEGLPEKIQRAALTGFVGD